MALLIKNALEILTMTKGIGLIKNATLLMDGGVFTAIGSFRVPKKCRTIDAKGCVVCPGFVDSHTHLVYGGSREDEFALRCSGVAYEKIAKAGGGIASTVKRTRKASEDELYDFATKRIANVIKHGTTTIEIKSGYGLSPVEELKMLMVINKLKKNVPLDIVPTYLAHIIPRGMKRRDYLDLITEDLIPEVAKKKLAAFCDVFCDRIAFRKKESERILSKAKEHNLGLKMHADQFSNSGGARLAARLKCTSAEHLEYTTRRGIKSMKKAGVIPTLLPGTSLFLQARKKPNIKAFQDTKSCVAIASDFNPGSCMIYAMPKIISLACIIYGMHVEDALIGATKNGAKALALFDSLGSIELGKQADAVIFNVDTYKKIPYYFGEDIVKCTIKKGRIIYGENS